MLSEITVAFPWEPSSSQNLNQDPSWRAKGNSFLPSKSTVNSVCSESVQAFYLSGDLKSEDKF